MEELTRHQHQQNATACEKALCGRLSASALEPMKPIAAAAAVTPSPAEEAECSRGSVCTAWATEPAEARRYNRKTAVGMVDSSNGSPNRSSLDYDADAVSAYGVQLRSWVELQVDLRLREVLRGVLERELADFGQAMLGTRSALERLQSEAASQRDTQSKLMAVVESLAEELGDLKVASLTQRDIVAKVASLAQRDIVAGEGVDVRATEVEAAVGRVADAVEEMRGSLTQEETERRACCSDLAALTVRCARQEDELRDLRQEQEVTESAIAELQRSNVVMQRAAAFRGAEVAERQELELRLSAWRSEVSSDVAQKIASVADLESRLAQQSQAAQGDVEARLSSDVRKLRLDLSRLADEHSATQAEMRRVTLKEGGEDRHRESRGRLHAEPIARRVDANAVAAAKSEFASELRAAQARTKRDLAGQNRLLEELRAHVGDSQERLETGLGALATQAQTLESRLESGLVALQRRLSAELHADVSAARRSEASALAALDEQLWMTDQRLGQRIDELAKLQVRERFVTVAGCPASTALVTPSSTLEPVTATVGAGSVSATTLEATASELLLRASELASTASTTRLLP